MKYIMMTCTPHPVPVEQLDYYLELEDFYISVCHLGSRENIVLAYREFSNQDDYHDFLEDLNILETRIQFLKSRQMPYKPDSLSVRLSI